MTLQCCAHPDDFCQGALAQIPFCIVSNWEGPSSPDYSCLLFCGNHHMLSWEDASNAQWFSPPEDFLLYPDIPGSSVLECSWQ